MRTFVYSRVEYALPLQPTPASVLLAWSNLERAALSYILRVRAVTVSETGRARALCRLPYLPTRRR